MIMIDVAYEFFCPLALAVVVVAILYLYGKYFASKDRKKEITDT